MRVFFRFKYFFSPKRAIRWIFLFIIFIFCSATFAQQTRNEEITTRILFILDASNSMNGQWETGTKMEIARRLLSEMVDSLDEFPNVELAMRVYGHQSPVPPQDCSDTKLEVPFGKKNAVRIKFKLGQIEAKGTTPIAHSLELCEQDFTPCLDCRNVVILISDGIEACDGDPCKVSLALLKKGIVLKPFIIGVGLDLKTREAFECVGHFFDAANEQKFKQVLDIIVSQALISTTAQVNLLDINGKPAETNVNMTFFDKATGQIKYNFIHTLNELGNPDTLVLESMSIYDIIVQTLPPIKINDVKLQAGKHNIIKASAPQGFLVIKEMAGNAYTGLKYIVRKNKSMLTLNVQEMGQTEKYIVGKYDLEILTLPRIYKYGVNISQSETTTIEIPQPGVVTIDLPDFGYGSLYREGDNQLTWVCNLNNMKHFDLTLQPGKYMISFRAQNVKQTSLTITQSFIVRSGYSNYLKL